jgi:CHAT domain-containing protein
VTVIPDAGLALLPFEVLNVPRPDGTVAFVADLYTIRYAPSATVLAQQRGEGPAAGAAPSRLFALGDPIYDETDPRASGGVGRPPRTGAAERALRDYSRTRRAGLFARLPATDREVRDVASALKVSPAASEIRLGARASERGLKDHDLSTYGYVHFATHGILAGDVPYLKQPALVLAQVGDLGGEDGLLTMEEVVDLRLDARLTALSACQTGLGREMSGEGVVGLARAFLYAGSRSVVVSLWRVADDSTATLMSRFYHHVAGGRTLAEALAQAKRELRHDPEGRHAHPFFWAPFILYGPE